MPPMNSNWFEYLGVADDVAAPPRVAPPARRVRLDVGRRPLNPELHADVRRRVHLQARAPDRRELGPGLRLGRLAVQLRVRHAAVVGGPEAAHDVRAGLRFGVAEVVRAVAVVAVDVHVTEGGDVGAGHVELGRLAPPHEAQFRRRAEEEPERKPEVDGILRIDAVVDVAVESRDGVAADTVSQGPTDDPRELYLGRLRPCRGAEHHEHQDAEKCLPNHPNLLLRYFAGIDNQPS